MKCSYGEKCTARQCNREHPNAVCADPNHCPLPHCPLRHYAYLCKYIPCANPKCSFRHPKKPAPGDAAQAGDEAAAAAEGPCYHNGKCFKKECQRYHSVPLCDDPDHCPDAHCSLRHWGALCKHVSCYTPGCKFRHRLEVIGKSEEPCKYDKACIAKACPSRHTTPLCSHPADCALPQCQSRHFAHLCKFKPCGNQNCTYRHAKAPEVAVQVQPEIDADKHVLEFPPSFLAYVQAKKSVEIARLQAVHGVTITLKEQSGRVVVSGPADGQQAVIDELTSILASFRAYASSFRYFGFFASGSKAVYCSGGAVSRVLLEDEDLDVIINNLPAALAHSPLTGATVLQQLKERLPQLPEDPAIELIHVKDNTVNALVYCQDPASVKHIKSLSGTVFLDRVVTTKLMHARNAADNTCLRSKVSVIWPTGPSQGSAMIIFSQPDKVDQFRSTYHNTMFEGTRISVLVADVSNKNPERKAVYVNFLSHHVGEQRLLDLIHPLDPGAFVNVKRQFRGDYDSKPLVATIEQCVGLGPDDFMKLSFEKTSTEGVAFIVNFAEATENVVRNLRNVLKGVKVYEQAPRVAVDYQMQALPFHDVFRKLQVSIDGVVAAATAQGIKCRTQQPTPPLTPLKKVVLNFSSSNLEALKQCNEMLQRIIEPVRFDSPNKIHLFHEYGLNLMSAINANTKDAHVIWIPGLKSILVYGTTGGKEQVCGQLSTAANEIAAMVMHKATILPVQLRHFRVFIQDIKRTPGLLVLELEGNKLSFAGSEAACEAVQATIKPFVTEADILKTSSLSDSEHDCQLCLCEIDLSDADDPPFTLLMCGHKFHRECLRPGLNAYTATFPLKCFVEGCQELIVWQDLASVCSVDSLEALKEASLSAFLQACPTLAACLTPDCNQVRPVTCTQKFACNTCGKTYCPTCSLATGRLADADHVGIDCELFRKADLGSVLVKLSDAMTLQRPCCGGAVTREVWDGCAAVGCSNCSKQFCGLCLEYVDPSNAHPHVNVCNTFGSGYFPTPDQYITRHGALVQRRLTEAVKVLCAKDDGHVFVRIVLKQLAPMLKEFKLEPEMFEPVILEAIRK